MAEKTEIRFFTIADYEEEEIWLREQNKRGWRLLKMNQPCFYVFEKCEPEDVVYRLDYKNNAETEGYYQLFRDYGWEYVDRCAGWLYFRKKAAETDSERDCELFSDNSSRLDMIDRVIKTRLLPVLIIFLCCIVPNLHWCFETGDAIAAVLAVLFSVLTLLFLCLLIYCGTKLRRLRKKYSDG